jgi:hypothetical protein
MLYQQQKNIHVPEEETQPLLDQEHATRSISSWRSWIPLAVYPQHAV